MSEPLVVHVEAFGPDQAAHERVVRELVGSGPLRRVVGADHRLLSLELLEPERKTAAPKARERYRATFYDYGGNRAVHAEGPLGGSGKAGVRVSAGQPRPTIVGVNMIR